MSTEIAVVKEAMVSTVDVLSPAGRLMEWLAGLKPNTRAAYQHDLITFAKFIGLAGPGEAVAALCEMEPRAALVSLERFRQHRIDLHLSPAAINRPLSTINSALRHLAKADFGPGILDVKGVPSERVKDARGPDPSEIAGKLLVLESDNTPQSARDVAIIRLAAQRGLRRSEISGIDFSDYDPDRSEVRITRKGKTQKVAVRIPQQTRKALDRWLAIRPTMAQDGEPAMFVTITPRPDQSGLRLSGGAIFRMVKKFGGGGTAWRPHGLRHTAITTVLDRTNNLEAARVLAGHAKVSTTQMYLDNASGMESLAVAAMERDFK